MKPSAPVNTAVLRLLLGLGGVFAVGIFLCAGILFGWGWRATWIALLALGAGTMLVRAVSAGIGLVQTLRSPELRSLDSGVELLRQVCLFGGVLVWLTSLVFRWDFGEDVGLGAIICSAVLGLLAWIRAVARLVRQRLERGAQRQAPEE